MRSYVMRSEGADVQHEVEHLLVDGLELLQRLPAGDGVDQDEGVTFGDGKALHGGELVAAGGVGNLQRAHALITADHLPVRVLHCGDVRVPERSLHKPQHQRAFPNSAGSEHHHPVIVTLLRHG
ncbi:hypothetical protein AOLI_G00116810 [Acnodon oligacanthus]